MKIFRNITLIFATLLCFSEVRGGSTEESEFYCYTNLRFKYDSIENNYKCYVVPTATQLYARPIYGDIEKTIVEYDSIIVLQVANPVFIGIDTLTNLGSYNQANDSLILDSKKWENGESYSIIAVGNVFTDTTPPFNCFPLYNYRSSGRVTHTIPKETKINDVKTQQFFDLSANVVQNNLKVVWADNFTPSHGIIYSVSGQILRRFSAETPYNNVVDVSMLENGFYLLSVQNKHGISNAWFKICR